jgi:hypothetical protein
MTDKTKDKKLGGSLQTVDFHLGRCVAPTPSTSLFNKLILNGHA